MYGISCLCAADNDFLFEYQAEKNHLIDLHRQQDTHHVALKECHEIIAV